MIRDLPEGSYWSLAGIGDAQLSMNSLAIAMGGGVRVGLEDNIYYDPQRTRLATNSDLLQRVHVLAQAHGRAVMAPRELRSLLNLERGHGWYGRAAESLSRPFLIRENAVSAGPVSRVLPATEARSP